MKIKIQNVSVFIGDPQSVLFHIPNFEIRSGEKILLKGASGRGKTTFLHLIAGLFVPQEGEVWVAETCISQMGEEARCQYRRKNIGFIFQKLNLIEHLTVKENIALALTQPCSQASVAQALSTVDLSGREDQMIASMSLGEQQRVAVARMILSQSSLTLADEPTSSLDARNALRVAEALIEANSKRTLVTVSHDPRIEDYFDRVVEFEDLCRL